MGAPVSEIRDKAIKLISTYLGDVVANSYKDFYSDKDANIVKTSVSELLSDYMGEKKALELLTKNGIS